MSNSAATEVEPMLDLCQEAEELRDAFRVAKNRMLGSSQFIFGPEVESLEQHAASFLGMRHAVAVNSGTGALVIALRTLGVGKGDEVITTPFSFFANTESISSVGAEPVFVDIEEDTFNLDSERLAERISQRARAIILVRLFGRPSSIEEINAVALNNGVSVLEGCAQSFGAYVIGRLTGTLGDTSAFSLVLSKHLGAYGDGRTIATNREDIAEPARILRAHGGRRKYHNKMVGYGPRLEGLQAAILRVKLPHARRWIERRREVARTRQSLLQNVPGLATPPITDGHAVHQYTVRTIGADRDKVQTHLQLHGVDSMVYYPVPRDRLPVRAGSRTTKPVSDMVAEQVLSLPIGLYFFGQTQHQVTGALREALA